MRKLIAFASMFGVHWVAQCIAWAIAESPFTGRRSVAWDLLSFPTFALGGELPNLDFSQLMAANSAVWATVFVAVVGAWTRLRARKPTMAAQDVANDAG